jgi:hypothetical protein
MKKSALFAKLCLCLFILGSCFLPGCEVIEEFICPCSDQNYPAYYPGGKDCYSNTGQCEAANPGKICKECGI